jgi:hypothetical protein
VRRLVEVPSQARALGLLRNPSTRGTVLAFFPCSAEGRHRHPGPNSSYYFAVVNAGMDSRWKLRLCTRHLTEVHDYLAQFEVDPVDDATGTAGPRTKCVSCLKPVDERGWQFFATGYPAKDERKDYWGQLHTDCNIPKLLQDPPMA